MKQRVIVTSLALLAAALSFDPALGAYSRMSKSNPDWPCQQILVSHLSPAAMWTGPSIADADKTSDPKIDDLAARLAQRRMPIAEAKTEIDAFAKAAGADRQKKLTALFAALFDKLDGERSQVIGGLVRFGHRQIDMAAKIRAENAKLHEVQDKSTAPDRANDPSSPASVAAKKLQWDLRIFQDRHKTLSYVCEVPVVIEQRLFALAQEIQNNMN
ncbi:hypothetical protein [Methylovirgula sp. HY1]|uniref:hypothetical protein n=1 Tax=Methylovirgula sp. HY1 TaxID=2822761 RepID=UPI001C5A9A9A|nr:hypothetical protein [Methylovirgula sp. HY1]QXX75381.1 hypothetical protein MHY1_02200 [Methylovirgula sp. HY1]